MNPEKLKAPSGLCGHHRNAWKRMTVSRYDRFAVMLSRICLTGRSPRCTHHHESDR